MHDLRSFSRIFIPVCLLAVAFSFAASGCGEPTTPLPDPTDNNTIDSAWTVTMPYSDTISVPLTDSAEIFEFGVPAGKSFGSVILIKLRVLEPKTSAFYLRAELLTDNLTLLVDSKNSDDEPCAWVAARPGQVFYLRLTPKGDAGTDRYRYSLIISKSTINDPFEPDDDTATANEILPGFAHDGSYLCDAFADSVEPMKSLPDFYKFELTDTTMLYVKLSKLGGDSKPELVLYKPDGTLFEDVKDTTAVFDLITPYESKSFNSGYWFLEVTDERGSYPLWGKGLVAFNYLEPYSLIVSKTAL
jgi:hypothetical protein